MMLLARPRASSVEPSASLADANSVAQVRVTGFKVPGSEFKPVRDSFFEFVGRAERNASFLH